MKSTMSILRNAFIALSTASAITACSAADDLSADGEFDQIDESEEIKEISLALNSDPNCGTAAADRTYTSIISPQFTSPSTYFNGRNGCSRSYFVRVGDYRSGNTSKYNFFAFAGANPSTAAQCQDTRIMVYAFERKADGSAEFVQSRSLYGQPDFDASGTYIDCQLPWMPVDGDCTDIAGPFNLTTGRNYQFAVSARTNNGGVPVMQPIRMGNGQKRRCRPH